MKKKNIALIVLCILILLPLLFLVVDFGSFNFSLNFQKYHSFEQENLTFDFYGSFGTVRKLKVSEEGSKLCSLKISANSDIFDQDEPAVTLCDINMDGMSDLLVLSAIDDDDSDAHRALFVRKDDTFHRAQDIDVVNAEVSEGMLIGEERIFEHTAQTVEEHDVPYLISLVRTEYEYFDGGVIPARATELTYYSETQIYCLATWEYSDEYDELMSVDEDWLYPSQLATVYDELDELFKIELP